MTATTNTALVAAATTITTGLIVFLIGQAVLKFVYDPYLEQQRIMLDIIHSVFSYADAHAQRHDGSDVNDKMKERILEATYKFKSLAAELVAANTFVKGYGLWRYFFFAPTKEDILWIAAKLAVLSNSLCGQEVAVQDQLRHEILTKMGVSTKYTISEILSATAGA